MDNTAGPFKPPPIRSEGVEPIIVSRKEPAIVEVIEMIKRVGLLN